jgi:CheY-like chemotaxis protein
MTNSVSSNCPILVLEDDENDAWLLERALRKLSVSSQVHVVRDGGEGVDYLSGNGKYADRNSYPLPGLIITDLKMPGLSGLEVLKWLRAHPHFRSIPTLVLTSSRAESDVASAYGFGANSYMVKPSTLHDLEKLGRVIRDYWDACEMPATGSR